MARIEPTRQIALQIWWAFIWRAFLLVLASGFVIGIVFGAIGAVVNASPDSFGAVSGLLGLAVGIGVSIEVMFRILKKRFKGFEIVLESLEG